MDSQKAAVEIFLAGVESVKPDNLIRKFIAYQNDMLIIKDLSFSLKNIEELFIIGAGKASALMAKEMEFILQDRISGGHLITKYGHALPLKYIGITEAGHPVPDQNSLKASAEILKIAKKAHEGDLVLCLISGGGSALMTDLPEGCSLEDIKVLNDLLLKSGANINEMNCIRKHLSRIKGGFLAKAAWPAQLVSLILSDVIGDPLDVIASGPTSPDPTTFSDAIFLLEKYEIKDKVSPQIIQILQNGKQNKLEETPKENDEIFSRTHNLIIGNNSLALQSAKEKAESLGFQTQIITSTLEGEANDIVIQIFKMIKSIHELEVKVKICLLFGGEPTVKVNGNGKGGRNQHLTLLAAKMLQDLPGITFLSAGTDGTDGPTDAAGAIIDSETAKNMDREEIDVYLQNCDSYNFFKRKGGLITTGPTQTNVMDMVIVLLE